MSPILKPYDIKNGFWGQPTATLDWCERNYEVKFSKKLSKRFWTKVTDKRK